VVVEGGGGVTPTNILRFGGVLADAIWVYLKGYRYFTSARTPANLKKDVPNLKKYICFLLGADAKKQSGGGGGGGVILRKFLRFDGVLADAIWVYLIGYRHFTSARTPPNLH
jgi:hypothetical protein